MFKVTETFKDFLGSDRTEDFYFNLTKAEIIKMEWSYEGGFIRMLKTLIDKQNIPEMIKVFDLIIDSSYGVRTPDGRGFKKSKDILDDFKTTEAYSNIFMRFATDATFASDFLNGIIPQEIADEVSKMSEDEKKAALAKIQ